MSWQIFGIDTDEDESAEYYMSRTKERATIGNPSSLLATWKVSSIEAEQGSSYVIGVNSHFPSAWLLAAVITFIPLLFTGLVWSWWLVPGTAMLLLSLLTTSTFRYVVLRMGLRKYGYAGPVRRLDKNDIIRRVLGWDRQK